MIHQVTSRNHQLIKRLRRLRRRSYRDREGLFLLEGKRLLMEAADSGANITELLYVDSRVEEADLIKGKVQGPVHTSVVSEDLMAWVSDVVTSQGVLGVVEQVDIGLEDLTGGEISLLLVADQVRDPGNLGALVRISDAAGVDGFMTSRGTVDLYNPKVVRSAAGSHFHLPLVKDLEFNIISQGLKARGMKVLGLEPDGQSDYLEVDFGEPVAVVVGNEAFGTAEEHRGVLDGTLRIRMPGSAESLNVAAAAAVVLFEAVRQRSGKGGGSD